LLYYYSHSKLIFCTWKHRWRACLRYTVLFLQNWQNTFNLRASRRGLFWGQRGANHTSCLYVGVKRIYIRKICTQWQVGMVLNLAPLPRASFRVQQRGNPVWIDLITCNDKHCWGKSIFYCTVITQYEKFKIELKTTYRYHNVNQQINNSLELK